MTARDWLHAFASELGGAAPDDHTVEALLAARAASPARSKDWRGFARSGQAAQEA